MWIDLPEIELFGWATVERVTAAPLEIAGRGCLVLMTVSHVGSEILKLAFAETDEALELTPVHRLFSEERGWVQARLLTVGERLRSGSGGVTVASIAEAIPNRRVYNLEVGREHSFRVLRSQIWAHNTDYEGGAKAGLDLPVGKVVNSNMPHAAERAVGRAGFGSVQDARTALQEFAAGIERNGLPPGAIRDTAHADRVIVPNFGEGGAVVYQVKEGTLKLKTVLEWKPPQ